MAFSPTYKKMKVKQLQSRDMILSLEKLEMEIRALRLKIAMGVTAAEPNQKRRCISLRGIWKELQEVSDEEIESQKVSVAELVRVRTASRILTNSATLKGVL